MLNMSLESAGALRRALLGNAAFSGLSGAAILAGDPAITEWLGVGDVSLKALGALLLGFAIYLVFLGRSRQLRKDLVTGVIGSDWAWVLASLALVIFRPQWFTSWGILAILGIAGVVMTFAILQGRGLRKIALEG